MFQRRVEKGQCFQQPYLGLREFAVSRFESPRGDEQSDQELLDAGEFDLDYRAALDADAMRRVAEPQS